MLRAGGTYASESAHFCGGLGACSPSEDNTGRKGIVDERLEKIWSATKRDGRSSRRIAHLHLLKTLG